MKDKKRLYINIIATLLSAGVNLLITFFLTPYVVKYIGVESNGFVGLANNFVSYAQLFTIALNSMAGRFITIKIHQNDDEGASRYFSSVIIANILISVLLTLVFGVIILFIDRLFDVPTNLISDVKLLWAFIFANFILSVYSSIFSTATFVKERLDLSSIATIIGHILRAIVLILFYVVIKSTSVWYMGLATFGSGIALIIIHAIYKKKLLPNLKFSKDKFDFKAVKELLVSGGWNTIVKLSSILSSGMDLLISNIFVSATAMGVLSITKTLPTNLLSLFGAVGYVFAPQITINYAKKDYEEIKKQVIYAIRLLSMFSSVILGILFAFGKEFYALWQPTQDSSVLYILTIISCMQYVFCMPLEPLYNIFTATNKIKASSIALIMSSGLTILTVFISLNFATTDMAKLMIIAGTSSFMEIIRVLVFLPMYGAKCIKAKKSTFYPIILKNTISFVVITAVGFGLKSIYNVTGWGSLCIAAIILGVIGLGINMVFLLNKEDRKNLFLKIKNKLKREGV